MRFINRATILGEVASDPETRQTDNGPITRLRVETQTVRGNQTYREWHTVVAFGEMSEQLRGLEKEDAVFVTGELRTRVWEDRDTGKKMRSTEIVAFQALCQGAAPQSQNNQGGGWDDDDIPF